MVVMANVVTLLTSLSLSAITTNGIVQGGGAYFVISRNLGPQFGGAIGLLFFIAQAVATSLYVVGFAESVVDLYRKSGEPFTGDYGWDQRVIGLCTCVLLLGVALVGVGWVAKSQVFLLVILIATLVAVVVGAFFPDVPSEAANRDSGFLGMSSAAFAENLGSRYIVDPQTLTQQSLFSVFSVFFPAVTGIMAGANMSGDLADPSRAIPFGTLLGIAVTFVSYVIILWFLGATVVRCTDPAGTGFCDAPDFGSAAWAARLAADPDGAATLGGLLFDKLVISSVSLWEPLVYAGVFAATLSSALASLVGAPRILQALARDRLFDFDWFFYFSQLPFPDRTAKPSGGRRRAGSVAEAGDKPEPASPTAAQESPEPIRGYVLTFVVACACVLIGELNFIAPIISQFFLLSYALVNYACVAASVSKAPGWRPKFRFYHPAFAAVGAVLCLVLMFAFDWLTALAAVLVAFAAHRYLDIVEPDVDWGTASDALRYLRAVRALHALSRVRTDLITDVHHAKVFRPSYLAVVPGSDPVPRAGPVLGLLSALWRGRGLSLVAQVLPDRSAARSLLLETERRDVERILSGADDGRDDDAEDDIDEAVEAARAQHRDVPSAPVAAASGGVPEAVAPAAPPAGPIDLVGSSRTHRRRLDRLLDAVCSQGGRRAFFASSVAHAATTRLGIRFLVESAGVSALRPNTVALEWPFDDTTASAYKAGSAPHPSVLDATCADGVSCATVPQLESFEGAVCDAIGGKHGIMVVRDPKGKLVPLSAAPGPAGGAGGGSIGSALSTRLGAGAAERELPRVTGGGTVDVWWLDWDGGLALLVPWLLRQSAAFESAGLRVFTSGSPDGVDSDATLAADERTSNLARLMALLRFDATPKSVKLNATDASREGIRRFSGTLPGLLTQQDLAGAIDRFRRSAPDALRKAVEDAEDHGDAVAEPGAAAAADPAAETDNAAGAGADASRPEQVAVTVGGGDAAPPADEAAGPAPDAADDPAGPTRPPYDEAALRAGLATLSIDRRRRLVEISLWAIRAGDIIRETSSDASVVFVVFPQPRKWFPLGVEAAWMDALSHSLPPTILIRGNGAVVVTGSS